MYQRGDDQSNPSLTFHYRSEAASAKFDKPAITGRRAALLEIHRSSERKRLRKRLLWTFGVSGFVIPIFFWWLVYRIETINGSTVSFFEVVGNFFWIALLWGLVTAVLFSVLVLVSGKADWTPNKFWPFFSSQHRGDRPNKGR